VQHEDPEYVRQLEDKLEEASDIIHEMMGCINSLPLSPADFLGEELYDRYSLFWYGDTSG
jgi:hypothetical protein